MTNDAAERLRARLRDHDQRNKDRRENNRLVTVDADDLRAALAAERRATVERIRAALLAEAFIPPGVEVPFLAGIAMARTHYLAILDSEANR